MPILNREIDVPVPNQDSPHQLNGGLAPARAEEKLNIVSGIS
jgi:hypothetical protein